MSPKPDTIAKGDLRPSGTAESGEGVSGMRDYCLQAQNTSAIIPAAKAWGMYETNNAKGSDESVMAQSSCGTSENVTLTTQFHKMTERKKII